MRVTAIAGGTGGAKLLRGLAACLAPAELTIIGNTGDDADVWGLSVSPDLDGITYTLAGRLDRQRGWGLLGETFRCLEGMAEYGAETWFNLGDRDLATHLFRTLALRGGATLSAVTATIARRLGVEPRIVPMSDDPVRTRLRTPDGWLAFQEYFVRDKTAVAVREVAYAGAEAARPAPGVVPAILEADLVVVCPSNPVTSVGPVLAVPGVVEALARTPGRVVAVSPIVGDAAVSGPAAELLRTRGLPASPVGVAQAYAPWLDVLLLDPRDAGAATDLRDAGVRPVLTDVLMPDGEREVALARRVLEAAA